MDFHNESFPFVLDKRWESASLQRSPWGRRAGRILPLALVEAPGPYSAARTQRAVLRATVRHGLAPRGDVPWQRIRGVEAEYEASLRDPLTNPELLAKAADDGVNTMLTPNSNAEPGRPGQAWFSTTHWSTVLAAGAGQSPRSTEALEHLCRVYWYPLYAYVRRRGFTSHEAEDLTQEFLARFLAGDYLARVSPAKGRFRSYLLGALNHFLADAWDHERRQKRGGGRGVVSIAALRGESRYAFEPSHEESPDRLYERRWALALLEQVLTRLEQEYAQAGKARLFQQLKPSLTGDEASAANAETARELGMTAGALRVAAHRLRRRYGELFRLEIAHTVGGPEEVEEELRHLLTTLRG